MDVIEAGHIAGYGCDDGGPHLWFDDRGAARWRRVRVRPVGEALCLRASSRRYCTGRHDLSSGRSEPCPLQRELGDAAFEQCAPCARATGFNPAFYNATEISPQQRAYNAAGHLVYLAHFGGGLLKVGITHERRGIRRMLEQGARMGALLARFEDAYGARQLEAAIAQEFDVAETVRASRKRKLLGSPFRPEVARTELLAMVERIADAHPPVDAQPAVMAFDAHYGALDQPTLAAVDLSEPPGDAELSISGDCRAMIGDILVVQGRGAQGGQRFMCSVGQLVGRAIELTDRVIDNRVVGQMTLQF